MMNYQNQTMGKFKPDWNKLFMLCLGLFIGGFFGMRLLEDDLIFNEAKFSVIGLELFYSKERIIEIFTSIGDQVRTILGYHLTYDFVFMAGCYPGIVCLCMIAAKRIDSKTLRRILLILAFLQLIPWLFDVIENYLLLKWLYHPVIGDEFGFYHLVVYSKWIIAVSTALFAITILVSSMFKRKKSVN